MITAIISFLAGLLTGVLVMRKHHQKAASIEARGRTILDVLKGR